MSYGTQVQLIRYTACGATGIALLIAIAVFAGLLSGGATASDVAKINSSLAIYFLSGFLALSCVLNLLAPRTRPRLIFLLGLFPLMIGWRIAALHDLSWIEALGGIAFVSYLALFAIIVVHGLKTPQEDGRPETTFPGVQLSFIRLYIGLDLVPHFTEKLFAGPSARLGDVKSFEALGVPDALGFVLLAGTIEFAAMIGVGMGLLTRLASILTVIYLIVATILGHHFQLGFIWATAGGGWEYPLLWSALILSFVLGGGRWLSLDQIIFERVKLPRWIDFLMGDTGPVRRDHPLPNSGQPDSTHPSLSDQRETGVNEDPITSAKA
ncbi:DoxX family protein [Roseibium sp. RKSG952]|uniref:DoxX family protein n=1 Tax=Roseibium sp. RKSG952 TaxID=2529384 RepID=UPI0018AD245F|nr:DoxX family protein [Roseibium sp. RKSG952]